MRLYCGLPTAVRLSAVWRSTPSIAAGPRSILQSEIDMTQGRLAAVHSYRQRAGESFAFLFLWRTGQRLYMFCNAKQFVSTKKIVTFAISDCNLRAQERSHYGCKYE